ncbi:hypothetical protein SERLA73DRAFT_165133 [Serpula lacrymans var. lacrymans S7.3]|uniref:ATP-dependent RNA helicase n=1 Tax=Serpula lacrymans var. lacrymans (strain S7.3) TaxID=936435 RepID=F8PJ79_SERL3|nr:hypothetical protein SERLA73DRAFT_165133 [Serpula lacrymans var. lacrymans S7.3]
MASSLWTKASRFSLSSRQQQSNAATAPFTSIPSQHEPAVSPQPTVSPIPDTTEAVNTGPSFTDLKHSISHDTLNALTVKPFTMTSMTPVQAEVLTLLPKLAEPYDPENCEVSSREPRDLLVKAKTGTGKTFAFLVPAVEARMKAIDAYGKKAVRDAGLVSDKHIEARAQRQFSREHVGAVIISPTRELATQIANSALKLTQHHNFEVRLFVGGASKRMQMRDWMKGRRDIVVTTPGRMRDLLENEPEVAKGISRCKMLILDEADTLLDLGFRDDIDAIAEYMPKTPERQTFLFSATVSPAIQQVARATLDKNHIFIDTVPENESNVHAHIAQYHTVLPKASDQLPHVLRLVAHDQLTNPGKSKIMMFFPTTKMTQLFATYFRELSRKVLPAGRQTRVYEIHSKKSMESRTTTSDMFRNDKTGASILISSDVSARGVDYPGVTRVIQVGIPAGTDQYIHRIGRTGRKGGTNGRGDLVLLPWEIGFLSWQLSEVPLKPVTTNELKSQIKDLCAKYDANPSEFFKDVPPSSVARLHQRGRSPPQPVTNYTTPISPAVGDIDSTVSDLLQNVDEEAVKETFTSMLGYYIAKSPELRIQKGNIIEGCKDWCVEACGLPTPPYLSESFLKRLGYSDNRTKHFGKPSRDKRSSSSGPSWAGRGSFGSRDRNSRTSSWGRDDNRSAHDDDFKSRPNKYGSQRYNRRTLNPLAKRDSAGKEQPMVSGMETQEGESGASTLISEKEASTEEIGTSQGTREVVDLAYDVNYAGACKVVSYTHIYLQ